MLSPAQTSLYWRTWSSICTYMGWKNSDSTHRYALHQEAGCPKSMTAFKNRDLDAYLQYCDSLKGDHSSRDRERERLIYRIKSDAQRGGLSDQYLSGLARDLYGLGCWDELAIDDLEKFRNTVKNRSGRHMAKAPKETALAATCSDNEPY